MAEPRAAPATRAHPAAAPDTFAAVDLGSNSFHMLIARVVQGELHVQDRLRETVRLAAGLDAQDRLTPEASERALACLERFGQRIRHLPTEAVRAVGTNTLRRARASRAFLRRAAKALGHAVEVLPGPEEARLIYLGVAHDIADDLGRRLVIDIGGGSTELIVGERFEPILADSLHMGCVSFSVQFFPGGLLDKPRFQEAELAARRELQGLERRYRAQGWEEVLGASGSINAIATILAQTGWSEEALSRAGLRRLRKALYQAGSVERAALPGLTAERAPVLPGAVAILSAVFDALGVESLRTSQSALREGLLYDLLGRIRHEDVRDRTIRAFGERYHVDAEQAARVERTAVQMLRAVARDWEVDLAEGQRFLSWAARLHEIGLALTFSGHHKHGSYLVLNSDMPGFSREDQALVGVLVRSHRRKLSRALFQQLVPFQARFALNLAVLLRLAVLLNRGRGVPTVPGLELRARKSFLEVQFPAGWLDEQPLARADLEAEALMLRGIGLQLRVQ